MNKGTIHLLIYGLLAYWAANARADFGQRCLGLRLAHAAIGLEENGRGDLSMQLRLRMTTPAYLRLQVV